MMCRRLGTLAAAFFLVALTWGSAAAFEGFAPDGQGTLYPDKANGRLTAVPQIEAYPLNGRSVKLDGKLDDEVWRDAMTGNGFRVSSPDRGAVPSVETTFKVAYDRDAVYFAVACPERDVRNASAKLSRRDKITSSDIVSIYIDPYFDKMTGYNFRVNPLGVQQDAYMFNDGERDDDWDAVWEAETWSDSTGWYTEVRIPFSSIRYRKSDDMTWGLQVYRYMHGRGEDTSWVTWDRDLRGFTSRFGELKGLRDVPAPRQIEISPYLLQRTMDPAVEAASGSPLDEIENTETFGADLKYGVTADLTLNATVQPDFGQVEADPAELNLSPFETFFAEKRPFFIEGSRFFQHPDFNLFYSRRVGTGDENSRIRFAAKLTGKTAKNVSVAAFMASTDLTGRGQAHNLFKDGEQATRYFVARIGKEFAGGTHSVNLMQTAVQRTDVSARDAYTSGLDFDLNFRNRAYNIQGSVVGSLIDFNSEVGKLYGTGGALDIRKRGGKGLRGGISGRWEGDRLRLNDIGYLSAPDEISTSGWLQHLYNPDGKSKVFNQANFNFNIWKNWLYGARQGIDANTGEVAWSYERGHRQGGGMNVNSWMQFRNYREAWWGVEYYPEGTQRYETRGGPLISEPTTYGSWLGVSTDTRKDLNGSVETSYYADVAKNVSVNVNVTGRWNQSSSVNHQATLHFRSRIDDTQYLETVDLSDPERSGSHGVGIGGMSYVFGKIRQRTVDLTLRTNLLFNRRQSLEVYLQPFLTVGDYTEARELAAADTYDLTSYTEDGYSVADNNFSYAAVNLNAVYRWEWRPGSALFLVWTHSRESYDERRYHGSGSGFDNGLGTSTLFRNEPQNVLMAKLTYWLAI